ncbi:hypothetical protein [Salinisphaera sp. G21_0]|uniref:hypothetical protein n=1 Tax=Salinisphaera sp. G21_0 TaxID=2821094 RepID=UPI001ADCA428|nr:hypothetical protein [Salinisphaera sp. G21_0]MBO9483798.1 hypothetical protein [Salinisphaera sp. G21_0]
MATIGTFTLKFNTDVSMAGTLRAAVAQDRAAVEQIKTDIEQIERGINADHSDVTAKHADVVKKHGEVEADRQEVASNKAAIDSIQGNINSQQSDITTRHTDIVDKHNAVKAQAAQVASNAQDVASNKAHVTQTVNNFNTTAANALQSVTGEGAKQNTRIIAQGDTQEDRVIKASNNEVASVTREGQTQRNLIGTASGNEQTVIRNAGAAQTNRVKEQGDIQDTRISFEGDILINKATEQANKAESEANQAKAIRDQLQYLTAPSNFIGRAGNAGFGAGVCPELPANFSAFAETYNQSAATYGNYRYSDGSIMVWVPLFYYRITGNNIEIASESDYENRAAAEADNFALHRAFIDGGQVQRGFFVDKYMVSANNGVASSIKDGLPMSSHSAHNPYSQVGAPNNYGGSIEACKTRGAQFFPASRFIHSALALLSLAHGQGATNDAYCAWYDSAGAKNYPKGCNNNALGDTDDNTVAYESDGYSNCGKTGSGSPFAKTTHNGQASGIADLNGLMWEVSLGITRPGTSSGDATAGNPGEFYCLKESVRMADLTSGWNAPTDAWGDATHIATVYDAVALPHIGHASSWVRFGNNEKPVLSAETSGNGWMTTGLGIFQPDGGSSGGANQFGRDGLYSYHRANLCLLSGGNWAHGSIAGVWCATLSNSRHYSGSHVGCRAACYLS